MLKTQKSTRTKVKEQELKTKYDMCKTNVKTNIYYVNVYKHEHGNNTTKLWRKIVLKIDVEQTKRK